MQKHILAITLVLLLLPTSVHAVPIIPLIEIGIGVYSNCQRATIGHCVEVVGALLSIKDFEATPITKSVNAVNCYESDPVQVKIHNQLWLSDQDVYANEVKVGTVKAQPPIFGEDQKISFTFTPFSPTGDAQRKDIAYMTMKGVGVGIIDNDKTRSQLVKVEVNHIASKEEFALWERSKDLRMEYNAASEKILFLSKKGRTIEDKTLPALDGGINAIKRCDFAIAITSFIEAEKEIENINQQWEQEDGWTKFEYDIVSNLVVILIGLLAILGIVIYFTMARENSPRIV